MKILHVVSELNPFVKTGGLADVAAALPAAQCEVGARARVLVPGYPGVLDAMRGVEVVWEDDDLFRGGRARLLRTQLELFAPATYVLDVPGFFDREGNPYLRNAMEEWPDNHLRFAALGWVAAHAFAGLDSEHRPDIVHAHDWQAGLAPAYLRYSKDVGPPSVMTIHNIDYAGRFPGAVFGELSLPNEAFAMHGAEFYEQVSFLKAGLYYADWITTVSPTYAREIQEEGRGGGLEGLLRDRTKRLTGILNGVDSAHWNPKTDRYILRRYGADTIERKEENRRALRVRLGLAPSLEDPLFGVVSRLVPQKGMDWIAEVAPWLVERGGQLAVTGSGDPILERSLLDLAARFPGRVAVHIGYDEGLAHWMQAGADAILVPSRSEPCGLTQLYALQYGSAPVVRRTGGLADTVVDATPESIADGTATGFVFEESTAQGLKQALYRALRIWRQKELWSQLQQTGMAEDRGWQSVARRYLELYRTILTR